VEPYEQQRVKLGTKCPLLFLKLRVASGAVCFEHMVLPDAILGSGQLVQRSMLFEAVASATEIEDTLADIYAKFERQVALAALTVYELHARRIETSYELNQRSFEILQGSAGNPTLQQRQALADAWNMWLASQAAIRKALVLNSVNTQNTYDNLFALLDDARRRLGDLLLRLYELFARIKDTAADLQLLQNALLNSTNFTDGLSRLERIKQKADDLSLTILQAIENAGPYDAPLDAYVTSRDPVTGTPTAYRTIPFRIWHEIEKTFENFWDDVEYCVKHPKKCFGGDGADETCYILGTSAFECVDFLGIGLVLCQTLCTVINWIIYGLMIAAILVFVFCCMPPLIRLCI
jgi:hypothetical protein